MSGSDPELEDDRRREAQRWLAVAKVDMQVVRLCLDADEPMFGIAAYHCQQAAEKVVKGMLVIAGVPFAKTHDMARLGDLATQRYPEHRDLFAELSQLTVWGHAYRYPALEDIPEPLPSADALQAAQATIERMANGLRLMARASQP